MRMSGACPDQVATVLVAALVGLTGLGGVASAEDEALGAAVVADAAQPDPRALAESCSAYLASLDSYSVTIGLLAGRDDVAGHTRPGTRLTVAKPNALYMVTDEGAAQSTIVCDGERLLLYLPMLDSCVRTEAPESVEGVAVQMLNTGAILGVDSGIHYCLDALFTTPPLRLVLEGAPEFQDLGTAPVGQTECHGVRVKRTAGGVVDLWIKSGDTPLLRRIWSHDDRPVDQLGPEQYVMGGVFSEWQANPELPAGTFAFEPPEGTRSVPTLADALTAAALVLHPQVDEKAVSLLTDCAAYLTGLSQFRVTIVAKGQGAEGTVVGTQRVTAQRPNRLRVESSAEGHETLVVSGDEGVFGYVPGVRKYAAAGAADDYDGVLEALSGMGGEVLLPGDAGGVLFALLYSDVSAVLAPPGAPVQYIGVDQLGADACHKVLFGYGAYYWVQVNGPRLLRKMELRTWSVTGELYAAMMITLSDWETTPLLDAGTFTFDAPADATRVDNLGDAMTEMLGRRATPK